MKSNISRFAACCIIFFAFIVFGNICTPFKNDRPNACYLGFGYDNALFTLELGYARGVELPRFNRQLVLNADLTIPMLKPDIFDWRARTGAMITTIKWGKFYVPVHFDAIFRSGKNSSCRAMGFGTALSVMPGIRIRKISLNAEVTWDQQWSTYIKHTDAYRQWVFADAKDGWYKSTAFIIRYGARTGILVNDRIEVLLRGGYEQDGVYDYQTPPFYEILSANMRL